MGVEAENPLEHRLARFCTEQTGVRRGLDLLGGLVLACAASAAPRVWCEGTLQVRWCEVVVISCFFLRGVLRLRSYWSLSCDHRLYFDDGLT